MSKKKEKKEIYKSSKWLLVFLIAILSIMVVVRNKTLDNDIWYLLSEGRYILNNGLYHIDPLSMHEGLNVVVQNWLSASVLWVIYDFFGEMGLLLLIVLCNIAICILLYKICYLISEENKILSTIIMFICDMTLITHFIVSRPQIFSYITLLGLIYALELYIHKKDKKYLIWIPIISFIQINMHASLWIMLFLFILCYVIDSFHCKNLRLQGYEKKPLFIAIIIAILVGFINPYGYKAITFIFGSFLDSYMRIFIKELLPFSINNDLCKHMAIIILIIGLIYTYFREGNVKVRYICLFCGTMILGFMAIKGFSNFILVAFFPLAYFFKDMVPKDLRNVFLPVQKIINIIFISFACLVIIGFGYVYISNKNTITLKHNAQGAIDTLLKYTDKEDATVYSSFNDGGYVEFRGLKAYIDPRAEYYLKKNNGKADIFKEFYDLQHGSLDAKEFIKKYNFTHLLVADTDYLYNKINTETDNYFILYDNTELGYRLYCRNDMFSDEERKKVIDSYNKVIEEAKKNQ